MQSLGHITSGCCAAAAAAPVQSAAFLGAALPQLTARPAGNKESGAQFMAATRNSQNVVTSYVSTKIEALLLPSTGVKLCESPVLDKPWSLTVSARFLVISSGDTGLVSPCFSLCGLKVCINKIHVQSQSVRNQLQCTNKHPVACAAYCHCVQVLPTGLQCFSLPRHMPPQHPSPGHPGCSCSVAAP
jgi:hypothetical protein